MTLFSKIGPAIAWSLGIFVMASLPGAITNAPFAEEYKPQHLDKAVHVIIFALGAILYAIATGSSWLGALLAFLIGLAKECLQEFIPGRSFEFTDIVADAIGCLLGSYLYLRYVRSRLPRQASR